MFVTLGRQAGTGLRLLLVMTLLCGIVYPLAIWAIARVPGLTHQAEGSIQPDGTGSSLIGIDLVAADPATDPYFHTRPSASSQDLLGPADPSISGGTNLGGFEPELIESVEQRKELIAAREDVPSSDIPADAVTASSSGLDPHISPDYAAIQVPRVARVTGLPEQQVQDLVAQATAGRTLGFLGSPRVNVGKLNLAVRHSLD